MSKILAIDLGKFKSVTCLLDTETNETEFWTMSTDRPYLLTVLQKYQPDLVVIESCSTSGWVHDTCTAAGFKVLVCNANQEAWKLKNVKRKTDRDDALKVARLAAVGQLVPVYISGPAAASLHAANSLIRDRAATRRRRRQGGGSGKFHDIATATQRRSFSRSNSASNALAGIGRPKR